MVDQTKGNIAREALPHTPESGGALLSPNAVAYREIAQELRAPADVGERRALADIPRSMRSSGTVGG